MFTPVPVPQGPPGIPRTNPDQVGDVPLESPLAGEEGPSNPFGEALGKATSDATGEDTSAGTPAPEDADDARPASASVVTDQRTNCAEGCMIDGMPIEPVRPLDQAGFDLEQPDRPMVVIGPAPSDSSIDQQQHSAVEPPRIQAGIVEPDSPVSPTGPIQAIPEPVMAPARDDVFQVRPAQRQGLVDPVFVIPVNSKQSSHRQPSVPMTLPDGAPGQARHEARGFGLTAGHGRVDDQLPVRPGSQQGMGPDAAGQLQPTKTDSSVAVQDRPVTDPEAVRPVQKSFMSNQQGASPAITRAAAVQEVVELRNLDQGLMTRPAPTMTTPSTPQAAPTTGQDASIDALLERNGPRLMGALRTISGTSGGAMSIRLDPPGLGTVRIRLSVTSSGVRASFITSGESARQLLEHSMPLLQKSLEAKGLNVERMSVQPGPQSNPTGRGDSQASGHGPAHEQGGQGRQDAADGQSRGRSDAEQEHGSQRKVPAGSREGEGESFEAHLQETVQDGSDAERQEQT